jgi:2-keto-3-deoxy-L-rhamnonate aldolase RhmA
VIDSAATALKTHVVAHLDEIAKFCGVDVFLLGPKFASLSDDVTQTLDAGRDRRWRVAIYGDMESAEHAKTRVLIFIDRLVSAQEYSLLWIRC